MCVFITAEPSTKLFAWGGGGYGWTCDTMMMMSFIVLSETKTKETTSRGLCGLGCSSRTSERGGEEDCVKEGGGGEGKGERERALERLRYYSAGH